jgi:murein DD-endopeptidase MepM/ murein hydrolase activator NlpD
LKHPVNILTAFLAICLLAACELNRPDQSSAAAEFSFASFYPRVVYNLVTNDLFTESHQVKPKQQFVDMLHGYKIPSRALASLNLLSRKDFDFRKIKVGQPYSLFIRPDSVCSLQALAYELNPTDFVIFHFNDSLRLEYCSKEVKMQERIISGTIESTLSEAISSQGISHELTNRMVDILGWQIDFYSLQKNDSFKIVYDEKWTENKPVGIGEIKGIYFSHSSRDFWAIPFDQGNGIDYFDREGNSIRRAFLKYPIEFTHISSRYSLNRFHPVLKVNRPHLGTDLSAATGTPIRTVGDGTVVEAGYNGGSGNYVKVKHNGTYTTGYLHMSKIGQGIKRGAYVRQGQVIGYVGSTGWATGPHLCYRFWKNGIQVDALKVAIPPDKPVRADAFQNFQCIADETLGKLLSFDTRQADYVALQ